MTDPISKTVALLRCIERKRCKVWDCGDGEARCFRVWIFGICVCV